MLATESATALLVVLVEQCIGLYLLPWVIVGLLCNISLGWFAWIVRDGTYSPFWASFLSGSRMKQTTYLVFTVEAYAFKKLCWLVLYALRGSGYVFSRDGLVDALLSITWIATIVLDHKINGLHLDFLYRLPEIVVSLCGPLILGTISWLRRKLISIIHLWPGLSPSEYIYSSVAAGEVRLLRLPRRLPYCNLNIEVVTVKLTEAPPYEAISYTWGISKQTRDIWLDGRVFTTSVAAHEVLQGRSSVWRSRLVWIDYICINQEDLSEKAAQVEQMTEVYSQAQRVVVWLGGLTCDRLTSLTTDMIHQLDLSLTRGASALRVYDGLALHQDTDAWISFIELWGHKWFTRTWIIQEAAVARELYFCYGGMSYPWQCFSQIASTFMKPDASVLLNRTAACRIAHRNMSTMGFIDQLRPILKHNETVKLMEELQDILRGLGIDPISEAAEDLMRSVYDCTYRKMFREGFLPKDDAISVIPLSFAHLLTAFSSLDITDARDRVFALRGMVSGDVSPNTRPDYTKTAETLYHSLADEIWHSETPFAVVGFAGVGLQRSLKLPSFVPDWSCVPKYYAPLTSACYRVQEIGLGYCACGDTKPRVKEKLPCEDAATIQLEAMVFDAVQILSDCFPQEQLYERHDSFESRENAYKAQTKWFNDARNLIHRAHIYPTEAALAEAFWRTLIADRKGEQYPAPAEMFEEYRVWVDHTERIIPKFIQTMDLDRQLTMEEMAVFKDLLTNTWSTHVAGGCSGRRFGITREGRMGTFLPGTRVGDEVCIAYGAATTWVIRRMDGETMVPRAQEPGLHRPIDANEAKSDYQLVGECYVHGVMRGEIALRDNRTKEIRLW